MKCKKSYKISLANIQLIKLFNIVIANLNISLIRNYTLYTYFLTSIY